MTDAELITLYFQRDESAIAHTAQQYGRLCRYIAQNILGNASDAEECENDGYIAVWNSIPPQRPQNFKAFLGSIIRNIALDRYDYNKAKKRNGEMNLILSELGECIAASDNVEQQYEQKEQADYINCFLQQLDQTSRMVFVRRYWYADSIEEIATRFSMGQSKVKSILFRTRNRLKTYLQQEGVSL